MSAKRQKNQLVLAFTEEGRSEAPKTPQEGTASLTAKCDTERPASHEQLMEEACERENCWQAYKRVKANKGSPGIDGMKAGDLSDYLEAVETRKTAIRKAPPTRSRQGSRRNRGGQSPRPLAARGQPRSTPRVAPRLLRLSWSSSPVRCFCVTL
jgi:hypothetical protein